MSTRRTPRPAFLLALTLAALAATVSAQQRDLKAEFEALGWQDGPARGDLGNATIVVPAGYQFVGRGGAGKFMELLENPSDGDELGVVLASEGRWFVVFSFSSAGYVKDTDRNLDADAILASIRKGNEAANDIRRERGWTALEVVGWQQAPFYDSRTNNLTWAIKGRSGTDLSINHSTRLLGRHGVMHVDLVVDPESLGVAIPAFNSLLGGFSFNSGQRYAEFTRGDKVAEYGLTGLIVGGTGVTLVKSGILSKFWKIIVAGIVAAGAAIKRMWGGRGRGLEDGSQGVNV